MEEEIEELLKETYKHIKIEVKYEYLRTYRIYLTIENETVNFIFVYNAHLTFNANIDIIKEKIDTNILKYYKKGYVIK